MEKYRAILLFGPPGSGKGTVGRFLGIAGNHVHLSSGDVFRGLDPETSLGKTYNSYASQGNLVPDDLVIDIWHQYVQGLMATNRYYPKKQLLLLDGIPRTTTQAEMLDAHIAVVKVLFLQVQDVEQLICRLQKRALIEKRQDDAQEEVLRRRMQVYKEETEGLLKYYPKESIVTINADQKPLEVLRDVLVEMAALL